MTVTPYGALHTQVMFLRANSGEYATSGSSQFALSYANHTYTATRTEFGAWFSLDVFMSRD